MAGPSPKTMQKPAPAKSQAEAPSRNQTEASGRGPLLDLGTQIGNMEMSRWLEQPAIDPLAAGPSEMEWLVPLGLPATPMTGVKKTIGRSEPLTQSSYGLQELIAELGLRPDSPEAIRLAQIVERYELNPRDEHLRTYLSSPEGGLAEALERLDEFGARSALQERHPALPGHHEPLAGETSVDELSPSVESGEPRGPRPRAAVTSIELTVEQVQLNASDRRILSRILRFAEQDPQNAGRLFETFVQWLVSNGRGGHPSLDVEQGVPRARRDADPAMDENFDEFGNFDDTGRIMDIGQSVEVTIEGRSGKFSEGFDPKNRKPIGKIAQLARDLRSNGRAVLVVPKLSPEAATQLKELLTRERGALGKDVSIQVIEYMPDRVPVRTPEAPPSASGAPQVKPSVGGGKVQTPGTTAKQASASEASIPVVGEEIGKVPEELMPAVAETAPAPVVPKAAQEPVVAQPTKSAAPVAPATNASPIQATKAAIAPFAQGATQETVTRMEPPRAVEEAARAENTMHANESFASGVGGAAFIIQAGIMSIRQQQEWDKADEEYERLRPEIERLSREGKWVVVYAIMDAPAAFNVTGYIAGYKEESEIEQFGTLVIDSGATREEALNPPFRPPELHAVKPEDTDQLYKPPKPIPELREGRVWKRYQYRILPGFGDPILQRQARDSSRPRLSDDGLPRTYESEGLSRQLKIAIRGDEIHVSAVDRRDGQPYEFKLTAWSRDTGLLRGVFVKAGGGEELESIILFNVDGTLTESYAPASASDATSRRKTVWSYAGY